MWTKTASREQFEHVVDDEIAADTQGVFRIPGSIRVVNALYDYYCADGNADEISSTIRCPNLPPHIKASTHDVASTFKRLLAGIPGGILGSLSLFDALVAIHSQLKGDPEFPRTKQTKLRARLMALAIGTVRSQFRRELISAVFGLLCLIGRAAENTPREDEQGRPLPTADLMGYNALGIVFGPLLVGDLINAYTMRLANPDAGLVLFPVTPPNAKRERRKSKAFDENHPRSLSVDKIHVANGIAEMLIIHWREVVKHMKSLEVLKIGRDGPDTLENQATKKAGLRPSTSESFVIRKPTEWSSTRDTSRSFGRGDSPIPPSPTPEASRFIPNIFLSLRRANVMGRTRIRWTPVAPWGRTIGAPCSTATPQDISCSVLIAKSCVHERIHAYLVPHRRGANTHGL